MKNMTIENMAKACNGKIFGEYDKAKEASGVVLDSRKLEPGFVFVATKGEKVDGHKFIPQVFANGAMTVVCEQLPEKLDGPVILVEDSFVALRDLAEFYRKQLDIKVVGITGSVGKTSTKEFIASVLSQKYNVHKTAGNYNNEIGVPLTIFQIKEEHQVAVLEMGINHFGEMHRLSKMARPDICVMTNIGQCHLEFLESRDGILRAKSEIFDFMAEDGLVCVNGDDDKLITIDEKKGHKPITFGLGRENDIYASDFISKGLFGSSVVLHGNLISDGIKEQILSADGIQTQEIGSGAMKEQISFPANIPLPGEHMVYNAMCATAVGFMLGLSVAQIQKGIASVKPTGGRSNIIQTKDYIVIDDCYNANPVSMEAAIDLLITAQGRKVAILGDMFELGENALALHRQVGAYAMTKHVNVLVCVGESSKAMYDGASAVIEADKSFFAATKLYYFETLEALEEQLDSIIQPDDNILIKASHSMGFEKLVERFKLTVD